MSQNLTDILNTFTLILAGAALLGMGFAGYEMYKLSDNYKRRAAKRKIEKGLPLYEDGQFCLDFMKDYL
jgi:hypothetical protein